MKLRRHSKEWALAIVGGRRYAAVTIGPYTLSFGTYEGWAVYGPGIAVMKWGGVYTLSVYLSTAWWWDVWTWGRPVDYYAGWKVDAWSGAVCPPEDEGEA